MRFHKISFSIIFALAFLLSTQVALSQNGYQLGSSKEFKVSGTSTLHDWDMISDDAKAQATIVLEDNQIKEIKSLSVDLPVKSLKSGNNRMDRTAYNAIDADKHSYVRFVLTEVKSITSRQVVASGNMTVAGTTRAVTFRTNYRVNGNSIRFYGAEEISFSQFDVSPPTALLGTVKTGDDLKISFDVNFDTTGRAK